jgi:hypothetical protein
MGSHSINVEGSLTKSRLSRGGQVLGVEPYKTKEIHVSDDEKQIHEEGETFQKNYELVKKEIIDEEGCRLKGYFYVKKVPGNFHISSHAYGDFVRQLSMEGHFKIDLSHHIVHLSFGDDKDIQTIKSKFGTGELSPLDNTSKDERQKKMYEYYMKVTLL